MALPTNESLQKTQRNMDTVDEFVSSTNDTLTDQYGGTRRTLTGINSNFDEMQAGEYTNRSEDAADRAEEAAEEAAQGVSAHNTNEESHPYLLSLINDLEDSQQSGVIVFQTLALLESYTPAVGEERASFKVTNDDISTDNNGYYSWVSGTTYTKDAELVVNEITQNNTSDAISGSAAYQADVVGKTFSDYGSLELGVLISGFVVLRQNGVLTPTAGWSVTEKLTVLPNTLYEYTGKLAASKGLAGYDAAGDFVEAYVNLDGNTYLGTFQFTTGATVVSIQASCEDTELSSFDVSLPDVVINDSYIKSITEGDINDVKGAGWTNENATENKLLASQSIQIDNFLSLGSLLDGFVVLRQNGILTASAGWSVTDFLEVYPNSLYEYTGNLSSSKGLAGYDKDQNFVEAYVNTDGGSYNGTFPFTTGPEVKYIRASCENIFLGSFAVQAKFYNITDLVIDQINSRKTPDSGVYSIYYVSPTGNDNNTGASELQSLATFDKAFELIEDNNGIIYAEGGIYRQSVDFSKLTAKTLKIIAADYDTVQIFGSDALTSVTKTGGRTTVYQAPLVTLIPSAFKGSRVFDTSLPSLPITFAESFPQQDGAKFRLPYTILRNIADQGSLAQNLDLLEAQVGGGIWHDEVNDILYMVASDGGDLTARNIDVPVRPTTIQKLSSQQNTTDMSLFNIEFYFSSSQGVYLDHFNTVETFKCKCYGSAENGWYEGPVNVIHNSSTAGDNGRDGFNGHFTEFPGALSLPNTKTGLAVLNNIWTHDNGDDGQSHHERGKGVINGSLAEHNNFEGFAQVNGSNFQYYNTIARKNGGDGFNTDYGVDDGRLATEALYYSCYAIENGGNGFINKSQALGGSVSKAYDCVSRDNVSSQYTALKGSIGDPFDSILELHNCKGTGSNIKVETNGGVITVVNDLDVV